MSLSVYKKIACCLPVVGIIVAQNEIEKRVYNAGKFRHYTNEWKYNARLTEAQINFMVSARKELWADRLTEINKIRAY